MAAKQTPVTMLSGFLGSGARSCLIRRQGRQSMPGPCALRPAAGCWHPRTAGRGWVLQPNLLWHLAVAEGSPPVQARRRCCATYCRTHT